VDVKKIFKEQVALLCAVLRYKMQAAETEKDT